MELKEDKIIIAGGLRVFGKAGAVMIVKSESEKMSISVLSDKQKGSVTVHTPQYIFPISPGQEAILLDGRADFADRCGRRNEQIFQLCDRQHLVLSEIALLSLLKENSILQELRRNGNAHHLLKKIVKCAAAIAVATAAHGPYKIEDIQHRRSEL